MSGLIWAGIGKGIADAGQMYGNAMMRDYEIKRQEDRELIRDERLARREEERDARAAEREVERDRRLLERQEALDELKAARARTTEEELQQRVIRESARVGTRAEEIGKTREGKAFDKLAESSALAGEQGDVALSKEQLQKLAKDNPALGEQYRSMGLIESSMPLTANERRMRRADDEVQASLDIGAHSTVQKAILEKRKAVLEEIREENKETERKAERAATNRRLDQTDQRLEQMATFQGRMAGAAETRADAAVTSAGAAVTRAEATARKAREIGGMSDARLNQEAETLRKAAKDASTTERRREYEDRLAEVLRTIAARRGSAPAPAASSSAPAASSSAPAAANSGAAPATARPGNNSGTRPPLGSFVR